MRSDGRLLALSVAAGIAVAVAITLLQDSTYRADASIVLARQGQPPGSDPELAAAADAAAELFHSRAVADSAVANLRLDESPEALLDRVEVAADADSSLVRVEAEGTSPAEARRTAQEVVEIATVLYNDRFGPQTVATIWETPRAEDERVSPDPLLNVLLGALAGGLLGRGLAGRSLPRRPMRAPAPAPAPAPGAPAQAPAPVPAPVAAPAPVPPDPEPVLTPQPGGAAEVPAHEPAAAPETPGPFIRPRFGSWTVADVERLLAEQGHAFPERLDELQVYLDSFRGVADEFGRFPGDVELVIEDVFEDLLERSRSGRLSGDRGHIGGDVADA